MKTVSHNTEAMRDWSTTMDDKAGSYDEKITRLYQLINQFVGSDDFKGGLSTDFEDKVISQKPLFEKYSATFAECAEIIRSRSENIDADEAELKNAMNRANPLDDIR